ncbi:hypothetical protein H310_12347 [Aphanomyces invadans]|uniref:Uncharacterized protein n=1 Tax=Aphanomyces invadans TaxID=157072 RepID=A0A024TIA2_9STRA|nr:hypothetical protein H310_12347 [Aphanomyces invadans]ETV93783.1 hypothetical protein H310_12347 [Aphanomyces invadans]|eukprot:XP_008877592.1 hypothetical protein H310_12347 [Aphanomyces invadans]
MLALFVVAKGIVAEQADIEDVLDSDLTMRYRFQSVIEQPSSAANAAAACSCKVANSHTVYLTPVNAPAHRPIHSPARHSNHSSAHRSTSQSQHKKRPPLDVSRRPIPGVVVEYKYVTKCPSRPRSTSDHATIVAGKHVPFQDADVRHWRNKRRPYIMSLPAVNEEDGMSCELCVSRQFTRSADTIAISILPSPPRKPASPA